MYIIEINSIRKMMLASCLVKLLTKMNNLMNQMATKRFNISESSKVLKDPVIIIFRGAIQISQMLRISHQI